MTYAETVEYLYTRTPLFQQHGAAAYKEGLGTTLALDAHFHHPHTRYHTIHIAGTNGKGSCSHTLASILQEAGYHVGLYTSPHLTDFRERIRVQGEMIPQERVVRFVEEERAFFEPLHPSFFEVTTALAFLYFAERQVDVAVVEVGLGGRLDCTNVITPLLSLITNISLDHTALLGDTLPLIAREKAGIIKPGVPVVVGEAEEEAVRAVFRSVAQAHGAPLQFAQDEARIDPTRVHTPLQGSYQQANTRTLLAALPLLQARLPRIDEGAIQRGFAHVLTNTHLRGRWQVLAHQPLTLCDIAHNPAGWASVFAQLQAVRGAGHLHLVFGMASDKDAQAAIRLMPRQRVTLYACQASVRRALPAQALHFLATEAGIPSHPYATVAEAYAAARAAARPGDTIFIGGSNFVVADFLSSAPTFLA